MTRLVDTRGRRKTTTHQRWGVVAGMVLSLTLAYTSVGWSQALPSEPKAAVSSSPQLDFRPAGRAGWFLSAYRAPIVRPSRSQNSDLVSTLLHDGKLSLTLRDAIQLAIENNFDVELQRYDRGFAATEILRAKGGGQLRGVPTTIEELPSGEGGPGEPLLTTVGGYAPVLQLPSSAADLATITGTQNDLSILSPTPFSSGPSVPQFDPSVAANVGLTQLDYPQSDAFATGSNYFSSHSLSAAVGYTQGFSTGTLLTATFTSNRVNEASTRLNLNPFTTGTLNVTLTQPLLQGFGIHVNRRFIHIATNDDSIAPVDLTSALAQVASNRQAYINSEGMVLQQELLLKEVLTRKGISEPALAAASIIAVTPIESPNSNTIEPLGTLLDEAMKQRPDLVLAEEQEDSTRAVLKGSHNALLPQLNLAASMQNNGGAGLASANVASGAATPPPSNLMGGYGSMLGQIFKRDYPDYSVGAQLNIPIHNRIARADAARDELQYRQSEVRVQQLHSQVRLQVGNAFIAVQQAQESYKAAVEARTLQEQALDVEHAKFEAGVATAYEFLQFQSSLARTPAQP